ncbi:hypothetical protein HDU82_008722 [Entophlyctis luteolus]|nr:hypothetical protein HDU82_008722 [Entophlyctis luteolus]
MIGVQMSLKVNLVWGAALASLGFTGSIAPELLTGILNRATTLAGLAALPAPDQYARITWQLAGLLGVCYAHAASQGNLGLLRTANIVRILAFFGFSWHCLVTKQLSSGFMVFALNDLAIALLTEWLEMRSALKAKKE